MPAWIDLTGGQFGLYKVLSYEGKEKWRCRCIGCGVIVIRRSSKIRRGVSGCIKCFRRIQKTHGHTTGYSPTKVYRAWCKMISRCTNTNNPDFDDYGGRGIKVCSRWGRFENFLADMGNPPEGTTLDRKNNAGGYLPGNCKWSAPREQANNRRSNRFLVFNGTRMTYIQ